MDKNLISWESILLEAVCGSYIPNEGRGEIPETVLISLGLPDILRKALENPLQKVKKIGKFLVGSYDEIPIGLFHQGLGSLPTEIIVRVLTKTPARNVIGVGLVGGLQEDVVVGDVILPTLSIRGEGTTSYYAKRNMMAIPNPKIQNVLERTMASDLKIHKGEVFTTSAFIKEDDNLITRLHEDGVLGIECETSVLFLISRLYGLDSGAILLVTDNPFLKVIWTDSSVGESIEKGFAKMTKAAYKAIMHLSYESDI